MGGIISAPGFLTIPANLVSSLGNFSCDGFSNVLSSSRGPCCLRPFCIYSLCAFRGAVRLSVALGTMGSSPHGDLGRGGRVIRLVLPSYAAWELTATCRRLSGILRRFHRSLPYAHNLPCGFDGSMAAASRVYCHSTQRRDIFADMASDTRTKRSRIAGWPASKSVCSLIPGLGFKCNARLTSSVTDPTSKHEK